MKEQLFLECQGKKICNDHFQLLKAVQFQLIRLNLEEYTKLPHYLY